MNNSREMKESSALYEMNKMQRRSRSNKPMYLTASLKKPMSGDGSDIGNESTTIGISEDTGSPLINHKRQGLSIDAS